MSQEEFKPTYVEALGDAYLRLGVAHLIINTIFSEVEPQDVVTEQQNDVEPDEVSTLQFQLLIERTLRKAIEMTAKENEKLALTDPLTGLPNRRNLTDRFQSQVWGSYKRNCYGDKDAIAGSILLFDIDKFADFNTKHGHKGGDRVLKNIAEVVDKHIRPTDIFGRLAGDEFVVMFPGLNEKDAKIASDNVVKAVREGTIATISGGIASIISDDFEENLNLADEALYLAKNSGRDRAASYDEFLGNG